MLLRFKTVRKVWLHRTVRSSSLLLQVTLLHLSTVKQLLQSALAKHAVDVVEARVHSLYDSLPQGQWALLRQTLAGFLLGKRVKVRHRASLVQFPMRALIKPEQPQGQCGLLRQTLAGFLFFFLGKRVKVRHCASPGRSWGQRASAQHVQCAQGLRLLRGCWQDSSGRVQVRHGARGGARPASTENPRHRMARQLSVHCLGPLSSRLEVLCPCK